MPALLLNYLLGFAAALTYALATRMSWPALGPARVLHVEAGRAVLLAMEEGLRHPGLTGGVGELSSRLTLMATVGMLLGRWLGGRFGRIAEGLGGAGLVALGAKILLEHTLLA
jgi:hypothetical protein